MKVNFLLCYVYLELSCNLEQAYFKTNELTCLLHLEVLDIGQQVSVAVVDVYPTLLWAQMFSLNGCLSKLAKA